MTDTCCMPRYSSKYVSLGGASGCRRGDRDLPYATLSASVRKLRERENRPDQLGMRMAYRLPPLLRTDVRKQ